MVDDLIIKAFDRPLDFLLWASDAPVRWKSENCLSRQTDKEATAWTGTHNYEEAYNLARHGWPEGLKLLSEKAKLAEVALKMRPGAGRQKTHSIMGFYPSPARAAAGEMLSMVQPLRPKLYPEGKLVKIRYDIGRPCDVKTEKIMMMGGALCAYINWLEASDLSVNLDAFSEVCPSKGSQGPPISFRFPLKNPRFRLAMADIVFWLAHPSALRRIQFSAMERLDIEKSYANTYGRPICISPPPADTLYLRIEDADDHDLKKCLDNIRNKHMAMLKPLSFLAQHLQTLNLNGG